MAKRVCDVRVLDVSANDGHLLLLGDELVHLRLGGLVLLGHALQRSLRNPDQSRQHGCNWYTKHRATVVAT